MKTVNEYTLYLQGVFGRNRKPKFELFKLAQIDVSEPALNEEALDKLVQDKLKEIKLKSSTRQFVKVNELTYKFEGDFSIMECKPFDAKTVKVYQ